MFGFSMQTCPKFSGQVVLISLVALSMTSLAADRDADPLAQQDALVSSKEIESRLEPLLSKHKVPGIVAGIVENGEFTAAGGVGLRKIGSPEAMTVNDKLHLGSNTKAMTATLIALLIERKLLSWNSTIGEIFPDLDPAPHPDFRKVTVLQLLTHRGGLPANGPWWKLGKGSLIDQRETLLRKILVKPPQHPPDSKLLYSKAGYVIAGHMAEKVTGKSWENLMSEHLFMPLKMTSAGFGIPSTKNQVDQPWGHQVTLGIQTTLQIDNDPALGPAGTVYCTIQDWSRFIGMHLEGARGTSQFLTPESFRVLHTPVSGDPFACGWIIAERPWAKGTVLTHTGSNTTWYSMVWIAPKLNAAFMSVTNHGDESGRKACDDAIVELIGLQAKSKKDRSE